MPSYEHATTGVNEDDMKPSPKGNEDVSNLLRKVNIENNGTKSKYKDYEYLILKPDHFKIDTLSKGKSIYKMKILI